MRLLTYHLFKTLFLNMLLQIDEIFKIEKINKNGIIL